MVEIFLVQCNYFNPEKIIMSHVGHRYQSLKLNILYFEILAPLTPQTTSLVTFGDIMDIPYCISHTQPKLDVMIFVIS